ncbi:hypothetical protein VTK56DRAFT_8428 [Thermocarpiscus australiensis]
MSSPPEFPPAPLEGIQKDVPSHGQSQHDENGKVQVDDIEKRTGKKKKRSKGGTGAKKRGTGFEEFFCEPPMTPAEHYEEKNIIYPSHRPFVDRIEECIQRFRARRRMDPLRNHVFSSYLALGGVDASARLFQSTGNIGDDILEDATKADVREMTANDVIQRGGDGNRSSRYYNPNYPEHWDVSFTGVVSGFLSEHLPKLVAMNMDDYRSGVEVVSNFLKYVDHHDVCPEYGDDVKDAQRVCLRALEEIPAIVELTELVPGNFNAAARALYCKTDEANFSSFDYYSGMSPLDRKGAKMSVAVTLSILLGPSRIETDKEWTVVETVEQSFEVSQITFPDAIAHAKYKATNQHLADYPDIQPCGTISARPVVIRDGWDNAMTDTTPEAAESLFILEENILQLLTVGTKLTMGVCALNVGLKFIKYVKDIKPSFYVFLPQELMLDFKEPVPNDRPAPSADDADGDEEIVSGTPGGDGDD